MNPELTEDLLAAAPVGSLLLVDDALGVNPPQVIASKADSDDSPWRHRDEWLDDREAAVVGVVRRARLYVPEQLRPPTRAERRDAAATVLARAAEPVPPTEWTAADEADAEQLTEGRFAFPADQRERIAAELLRIVEGVIHDGHTVRAYGVRLSKPDRTEEARLSEVMAARDAIEQDRDELLTVQDRILAHPALSGHVHRATPEGKPLMVGFLARLDELAALEGAVTEHADLSDDASTVGQWHALDERERHELIRAMPLERVEQLGAVWARAQDAAAGTVEQARALGRMLADVLHGTAERVEHVTPATTHDHTQGPIV